MNPENGGIPIIDPSVRYVGVSKLREFKAEKLRTLHQTLVIQDDEKPLAVMLSYNQFMEMQNERDQIVATLRALLRRKGRDLARSIADANSGNAKPFRDIQKTLSERKSVKKAVSGLNLEESDVVPSRPDPARRARLQHTAPKSRKVS